jgi:predicted DCC family thiol-disulfide oxidoreductase YuxK
MKLAELATDKHPLLIFDGVCNLCEWLVIFIVKRDKRSKFRFVAAQSELGQQIQQRNDIDAIRDSSMILLKDGQIFTRSDAAIEIAKELDGPWTLLRVLAIFPRSLRDLVYTWIGNNRYKWFGFKNQCLLPTEELASRFIG